MNEVPRKVTVQIHASYFSRPWMYEFEIILSEKENGWYDVIADYPDHVPQVIEETSTVMFRHSIMRLIDRTAINLGGRIESIMQVWHYEEE